jgi:conjugal transfer pilus assembly protein TraI
MLNKIKGFFYIEYDDVDDLVERYKHEIAAIKSYVGSEYLFERQYMPCIERYLAYVYLLPASESHHHSEEGGLARHGLEKAANILKRYSAKGVSVRDSNQYELKRETKEEYKRLRLAVFLAALIHDVGKVFTMRVYIEKKKDGKVIRSYWSGLTKSLLLFLYENNDFNFGVEWIEGRGTSHEGLAVVVLPFIAGDKVIHNLGLQKAHLLIEAIAPKPSKDNIIRKYLKDGFSTLYYRANSDT